MNAQSDISTFKQTLGLLRRVHITPAYFLPPILASMGAAAMEGISLGLLIPMLNGFLVKDFSFLKSTPVLSSLLEFLPASITTSDKALFAVLLAVFSLAILLKNALRFFSGWAMAYIDLRAIHHLRKLLFARYLSFGKLYFDRTSVGHHSAVFYNFLAVAVKPLFVMDGTINALLSLAVYLTMMMLISWKLTLIALPLFFALHFSIQFIITKMRLLSRSIARSASILNQKTIDILSSIPLVKSYNMEQRELRHYTSISEHKAGLDIRINVIEQTVRPIQELMILLALLALFSLMMFFLVQNGTTAAPSFLVYFYLVFNCASKFNAVSGLRTSLASASGPLHELMEALDDEGKFYIPDGPKHFAGLQKGIEFRDLSFSYPDGREVLKNLSFSIDEGKMTAIVGPTGAGKTTIVNLLLRFYDCPPGALFVDGTDIREFTAASLRAHMALVSQETQLLHDTLRSNIAYGVDHATDEQIRLVLDRARLAEFVSQMPGGLESVIGDKGVKLSGGEKQRVSIARALLKGAEILLLDEATSALDSKTEKLIQEAIDDAAADKTAIVIAHRLSTIKHADKIVVIDDGRCIEQGSLEELVARKGKFYEYWERQQFS